MLPISTARAAVRVGSTFCVLSTNKYPKVQGFCGRRNFSTTAHPGLEYGGSTPVFLSRIFRATPKVIANGTRLFSSLASDGKSSFDPSRIDIMAPVIPPPKIGSPSQTGWLPLIPTPSWSDVRCGRFNVLKASEFSEGLGKAGHDLSTKWDERHKWVDLSPMQAPTDPDTPFNAKRMMLAVEFRGPEKLDRTYFVKAFDPKKPEDIWRATREVGAVYAYRLWDGDDGDHSHYLTTFINVDSAGHMEIMRRFTNAVDLSNDIYGMGARLDLEECAKQYVLRVILGDMDLNNWRNVLITNVDLKVDGKVIKVDSRIIEKPKAFINIDLEFCFPHQKKLHPLYVRYLALHDLGTNRYDAESPIFGSFSYLFSEALRSENDARMFDTRYGSQNPYMYYLHNYIGNHNASVQDPSERIEPETLPIDSTVLSRFVETLDMLDYGLLTYGKGDWQVYTLEEIQASRQRVYEILTETKEKDLSRNDLARALSNIGIIRPGKTEILNHHAWAAWIIDANRRGMTLTLQDFVNVYRQDQS